ncbi:DDE superfamily endonuclease [Popillia japonica]|uniref:DDE superfamily endonuclease n=1 Tax=Popillia japonica TaxID=7064 RepID=A0AAW1MC05_POPJA
MHVNIKAPTNSTKYYNRKKTPSLILQGVCDNKLLLRDVYFGEVGSMHDSRVFCRSPLHRELQTNPERLLGKDGHLVGDSAYTLAHYMMTPFRDNGHLLDEQTHYNYIHASIRKSIERTFGLLKGKWRSLKALESTNLLYVQDHVVACCVLHNF